METTIQDPYQAGAAQAGEKIMQSGMIPVFFTPTQLIELDAFLKRSPFPSHLPSVRGAIVSICLAADRYAKAHPVAEGVESGVVSP